MRPSLIAALCSRPSYLHYDHNWRILEHETRDLTMPCPITARGLERVGEWWSMLIMRDALHGSRASIKHQNSFGIAPPTS